MPRTRLALAVLAVPLLAAGQSPAPPVLLVYNSALPPVRFAAAEIRLALTARGSTVREAAAWDDPRGDAFVLTLTADSSSSPQSYEIRRRRRAGVSTFEVTAPSAAGAMYGGLDVAEAIRTGSLDRLALGRRKPHIERRGIKFNIPLDLRTPSYSDNGDSFQGNIPEMWSHDFWNEFLDELARHRYNVLSLWSLHPFPSMVKVPEYPLVALDDVWRTRQKLDETFSHTGDDMLRPSMLSDVEVVRRMSIEEKIQFWRDVMQRAADRGIEVYLFTWNIFTFGAEGKYGITPRPDNPVTIDYFRKSVRETVLTYPLLAGIGITAGEQMENRRDDFSKEKWLWRTYGEGIRDALTLQPGRPFRLIHRFHQTGLNEIQEEFKAYPGPFDLSFKYAIAHMYSMPRPAFIDSALPFLKPSLRTWLTVRNDDIYSFRWADPAYARDFIRAMPGPDKVAGFYMGPDGYNWGREFLSTDPEAPRQLVLKKQWFSFLLWGRLAFEPDLPDERLAAILAERFPSVEPRSLLAAWSAASRVFPEITRFFWGDIDLRWYPEACLSHPRHRGFYTVRHFIEGHAMPGSGNLDILTWRERMLNRKGADGTTPLQVAANLSAHAKAALDGLPALRAKAGESKELRLTLGDIEAMAHLGNYYAEKILGAAGLAMFDATGEEPARQSSIGHLKAALQHWQRYSAVYARQYKPQLLNRVGFIDIPALAATVAADIDIARTWQQGAIDISGRKPPGADRPFRP